MKLTLEMLGDSFGRDIVHLSSCAKAWVDPAGGSGISRLLKIRSERVI